MKRKWVWTTVHLVVAGIFLAMFGTISCREEPGDGTGKGGGGGGCDMGGGGGK